MHLHALKSSLFCLLMVSHAINSCEAKARGARAKLGVHSRYFYKMHLFFRSAVCVEAFAEVTLHL